MRETSVRRFVLVLVTAVALLGLTWMHWEGLALALGILVGACFFLYGMATGGGLGNLRNYGQTPPDVSTRLGVAIAAAGIGAGAFGQAHFPMSFHIFYGICLGLGCLIAVILAARSIHKS